MSSLPFSRLICPNRRSRSLRFDTSPCMAVTFFADLFGRRSQLRLAPPCYKDVGAFIHKLLGRGKANAAVAARNERTFPLKLTHLFLLIFRNSLFLRALPFFLGGKAI